MNKEDGFSYKKDLLGEDILKKDLKKSEINKKIDKHLRTILNSGINDRKTLLDYLIEWEKDNEEN